MKMQLLYMEGRDRLSHTYKLDTVCSHTPDTLLDPRSEFSWMMIKEKTWYVPVTGMVVVQEGYWPRSCSAKSSLSVAFETGIKPESRLSVTQV